MLCWNTATVVDHYHTLTPYTFSCRQTRIMLKIFQVFSLSCAEQEKGHTAAIQAIFTEIYEETKRAKLGMDE